MSDIAIPGFSSDSNSAKMIENLMKAKRIPLEKMEIKQEEYTDLKGIWQDLNVTLSKLSDSANKLYGFENPFNEKSVISSNESILTAETERTAIDENLSFIIESIATTDKFVSYQIDSEAKVQKGSYSFLIGEELTTLKYRGGDFEDFVNKLNKRNPDKLHASLIKNSKTSQVLLIESLETGNENSLQLKDDAIKLGLDIGLIEKNSIENNKIKVNDLISSSGDISKTTYTLNLSPRSKVSFRVDSGINENDIFEIEVELKDISEDGNDPTLLKDLNIPNVTLENITINNEIGEPLKRFSPNDNSSTPILDMNIVTISDEKYTTKLNPIVDINNKKQTLTFTGKEIKKLKSINIINNNSNKTLLVNSVTQKKGAGRGEYVPINPITIAKNAKLYMNGMEIERESNDIDDLVDGTTLHLKSADPNEKVTLNIDYNTDYARDQILDFVYNYNESMKKIILLTNDDKAVISEIEFANDDAKKKAEEIQGTLRGDRTLNSIKQSLLRTITNAYATNDDNEYNLLKSIGISTNASGSTGVNVSKLRGYIEANVEELEAALKNNITSVKNLFGYDSNNDFIIDTGVAKLVDDNIKPYTRAGGIISNRISTIDSQIKRNDKDITDYKDDLITYEDSIRRKYGQMDATINNLNSSMTAIENLTNSGDN
ncbi:hypothetical protein EW093_13915 [Thiospirochaeta perfilievii]|uniref:Flagellar hook-associated protein 2 n=1 Tax=Thiospirochaeta perfilievii TaxID=252967 RepID=A0A5C1QCD5_9SPIO|nr:flagellar filament capping protein FliD [Thiospirochaeta perfilievii]QEN05753.1 hypothetical protein EW093_13915 [Thiospirochaeta perfilievii]